MSEAQPPKRNQEDVAARSSRMSDVQCDRLSYNFRVAVDKFKLDEMRAALSLDAKKTRSFHAVNTRQPQSYDYHAHFEWRLHDEKHEITLEITYIASVSEPKKGEGEPYADNVMQWLGQFFKYSDANARIHTDFEFATDKTSLSWFPLPLTTKVVDLGEGTIDGISVSLPLQPNGVSRFFLSQIKDSMFVGIESERRVQFSDFSLSKELEIERSLAARFIEVKQ